MKINEVVKMTNLTKKAIRYYEEKKLITIEINSETGYKDYSQENVDSLNEIAFLRNLEMSVYDIYKYFESDNKEETLKEHLTKVEEKISKFLNIKDSINQILTDKGSYLKINEKLVEVKKLNSDYVLNRISELFPTPFGKYIIIHFRSYLNEPIDTPQKQTALDAILKFLDDVKEEEFEDDIVVYLEQIVDDGLEEIYSELDSKVKEKFDINFEDEEQVEKIKNEVLEQIQFQKEHKEEFDEMHTLTQKLKKHLFECGYYEHFVNNLRIISEGYDEYLCKLEKVNEIVGVNSYLTK